MTETLSIKVPKAQKARLKALAEKKKTTITKLMRDALDGLAREVDRISPPSCFDLTRDLFEEPSKLGASKEGDRSSNKERLRSFGRRKK